MDSLIFAPKHGGNNSLGGSGANLGVVVIPQELILEEMARSQKGSALRIWKLAHDFLKKALKLGDFGMRGSPL
jgi:hypothetical protein